jgi:hypothetical protein
MKTKIIASLFGSFVLACFSASASAQQRTFVSGLGNDANPCSRLAPCRNFAQAISLTNAGGEVIVLDSAGYGPVSIIKSVSIIAPPGVYAGISVFAGDGIDINAGSTDTVILRGLTINNQGSIGSGIVFNFGGTLHVESCVVNGFSNSGVSGGLQLFGTGTLEVKDSIFRSNTYGINVAPASGTALAEIEEVRLEGNVNTGLVAQQNSKVTVRSSIASGGTTGFFASSNSAGAVQLNIERCVSSNNSGSGILAGSFSSGPAEVNIESCLVSGNGVGIDAASASSGIATARVSNSTVTDNSSGLRNEGAPAVLLTRGSNTIEGNAPNTFGTIGSYTAK